VVSLRKIKKAIVGKGLAVPFGPGGPISCGFQLLLLFFTGLHSTTPE